MNLSTKARLNQIQRKHLNAFVSQTMRQWNVPGVAVGVVDRGGGILSEGFGVRGLKRKEPVSAETLFAIASCSKAFTSLSVAIAVEEGKLNWETPVREYLPEFRLSDPYASERITPRDLLTHVSGLPRHDDVWWKCADSREQYIRKLRHLEPSKDLRVGYQYQNLMYMVAGYLVGRFYETTWEAFVQQRILDPLHMTHTNFSIAESRKSPDHAFPHSTVRNKTKAIDFYEVLEGVGPAGSMNSNVVDMLKWVLFHLNKGAVGGKQIIPASCVKKTHTPQVVCEASGFDAMPYLTYAMGWHATQYCGARLLYHGGNVGGFSCNVAFLPDDGFGIVVLTNLSNSPVGKVVTYHLCDLLLQREPLAWNSLFKELVDKEKSDAETKKKQQRKARIKGTLPFHPLQEYAGKYSHPAYGTIAVELRDGSLKSVYQSKTLPLEHYHYDFFERVDPSYGSRTLLSFQTASTGTIASLSVRLEPEVSEIVFKKVRDDTKANDRT